MSLTPGRKLAHYEILESVGAGGMGEVYRARDTKLGRDVAIKVLPEEFSRDKERLARFEREAHLLAQLNHSNIATLYGLEESDGRQFLVMELVEGETLAERIAKGPLPIDEVVPLFTQIAEGLEAAHAKAIIHRDLKPANIKIGPDGKPKILDFGLAKAFSREEGVSAETSQSPTLTKGTALGAITGTASYMSPEQARGKTVDKRTDIWAFGCCLFEALSGRKAFDGETVSDIISAVLQSEPQWDALAAAPPAAVQRLLRRCLVKDRKERIPDIGVARLELKEPSPDADSAARPPSRAWRRLATYIAMATAAALVAGWVKPGGGDTLRLPTRTVIELLGNEPAQGMAAVALSPDGRTLVYVAELAGVAQLFSRPLNSFEATPVPGTEGARGPFFSPDGQEVGFFTREHLKKVRLLGGIPTVIADVRTVVRGGGGTWADDDTIIFSTGVGSGLARVSAGGGGPEILTTPDEDKGGDRTFIPSNASRR